MQTGADVVASTPAIRAMERRVNLTQMKWVRRTQRKFAREDGSID